MVIVTKMNPLTDIIKRYPSSDFENMLRCIIEVHILKKTYDDKGISLHSTPYYRDFMDLTSEPLVSVLSTDLKDNLMAVVDMGPEEAERILSVLETWYLNYVHSFIEEETVIESICINIDTVTSNVILEIIFNSVYEARYKAMEEMYKLKNIDD